MWRLIRSLNSNEKLFFKRNFSAIPSPSRRVYLQLFDAIAAQKKYDEAVIIKKLSPALNKKNIASQKNYLLRQLCDSLLMYENRFQPGADIYKQIQLIRLYRKKGMLNEAHILWKKAVVQARSSESFALLNLLKTEFEKMIMFSSSHLKYDELHSIFKSNLITYTTYAEMITLRDIYTETLLLKRKAHYDMDEALKTRISTLLQQVDNCTPPEQNRSFWYGHYYRMSRATLLYLQNDINNSLGLLQELFTEWKKNTRFIATHGEYFVELLYMINYAGILQGSFNYVSAVFNDPVHELVKEPVQRANFEAIKHLALNKIYNKTARYNEVNRLLPNMKKKYTEWESLLNADMNRTVSLSLGIGYLVMEQFDDALYFLKRGITMFRDGVRDEQDATARLLLLLVSYSMNNSRLFDAEYRSAYAFFYKRKRKHIFEKELVQCLHRTFYMKDNKMKVAELKKTLAVFENNKTDVVQQMAFRIFNFPGWLMSRIQRISYRQFAEKMLKMKKGEYTAAAV